MNASAHASAYANALPTRSQTLEVRNGLRDEAIPFLPPHCSRSEGFRVVGPAEELERWQRHIIDSHFDAELGQLRSEYQRKAREIEAARRLSHRNVDVAS